MALSRRMLLASLAAAASTAAATAADHRPLRAARREDAAPAQPQSASERIRQLAVDETVEPVLIFLRHE